MSKVREAINLLETALPAIPIGTDSHKSVLSAIQSLSKSVPASEAVPGVQMSTLAGLQQEAQQQAPLQALVRSMGTAQPPAQAPI